MSIAGGVVRLYPSAFRARWGEELTAEATAAGWKSWPNLVLGGVDLWLHPAVWPADSRVQRQGRSAAMAVLITVAGWLMAHLATSSGASTFADVLDGCAALLGFGLALVAPVPLPTMRAVGSLLGRSTRLLTVPVLLTTAAVLVANFRPHSPASELVRLTVLGCWWGGWALGIVQGVRIIAGLGPDLVVPPRPSRIRLGVGVLTVTAGVAGATVLGFALTAGHLDPAPTMLAVMLLAAAAALGATLRDLCQLAGG